MAAVNFACLLGNVGQDPEIKTLNDGSKAARFSIATSESWKDKHTGEKKERTEWHHVVVFSQGLVSVVEQYVKKGTKLFVRGAIRTRKWVDSAGANRYSTEIVLSGYDAQLVLAGGGGGGRTYMPDSEDDYGGGATAAPPAGGFDDDIPF